MDKVNKYGGINDMPIGWTTATTENSKIYRLWFNMLRRCYDTSQFERAKGRTYQDCEVSEDWKRLSIFQKDIKTMKNYQSWLNSNDYAIDKDIILPGNKTYCLANCSFVPKLQNMRDMNKRHPEAHGLHKTKYVLVKDEEHIIFETEKEACEFLGVKKCTVASCYRAGCKCKGYKIERFNEAKVQEKIEA